MLKTKVVDGQTLIFRNGFWVNITKSEPKGEIYLSQIPTQVTEKYHLTGGEITPFSNLEIVDDVD